MHFKLLNNPPSQTFKSGDCAGCVATFIIGKSFFPYDSKSKSFPLALCGGAPSC